MNPNILRLIGTILEVFGTFFLAAEAIKIPNLRRLKERYLIPNFLRISPVARSLKAKREGSEPPTLYVWTLVLLGAILVYGLMLLRGPTVSEIWMMFRSIVPGPLVIDIVVAVPVSVLLLFVLSLFGSFFIQVLSMPLIVAILLFDFVERHTTSGIIGALGFFLFLLGAALKSYIDLTTR